MRRLRPRPSSVFHRFCISCAMEVLAGIAAGRGAQCTPWRGGGGNMFGRILTEIALIVVRWPQWLRKAALYLLLVLALAPFAGIIGAKIYQNADDDPDRGGVSVEKAVFDDYYARSEEHTSELQSLMRISYAVFCLKKTNKSCISKCQ